MKAGSFRGARRVHSGTVGATFFLAIEESRGREPRRDRGGHTPRRHLRDRRVLCGSVSTGACFRASTVGFVAQDGIQSQVEFGRKAGAARDRPAAREGREVGQGLFGGE